ncbi:helix-turn-helix transcriptional regulator [Vibrio alfacsensis]|uniref:helix-turn-helix transcriptional regulator n=1 Tax=Vibrio alfacsensis TaxID=1074311 RepID=UPI0040677584
MIKETSLLTVIGLCLKELRIKREITQGEMAKHIGMTNAGWGRLENGKASLSVENMIRACHFLDMTPQDFLIETSEISERLKSNGWQVHDQRIETDCLIAGREVEASYEKIAGTSYTNLPSAGVACSSPSFLMSIAVSSGAVAGAIASMPKKKESSKKQKTNNLLNGSLIAKAAAAYEWRESLQSNSNDNAE